MKAEAASEIGTVHILVGDDVKLEAANFRRGHGHEIRCYVGAAQALRRLEGPAG